MRREGGGGLFTAEGLSESMRVWAGGCDYGGGESLEQGFPESWKPGDRNA